MKIPYYISVILHNLYINSPIVRSVITYFFYVPVIACIHRITVNITVCINYIYAMMFCAVIILLKSLRYMSCHIG